jgi:hypothetical protein
LSRECKMGMEIVVQSDTYTPGSSGLTENCNVIGVFEADFRDMNRVEARLAKNGCCTRGETLGALMQIYSAKHASCNAIEAESLVIDTGGGVAECLLDVVGFEIKDIRRRWRRGRGIWRGVRERGAR